MWVDVIDNKDQSLTIEETISLQIEVCHVDGELGDSGDVERMWNCGWAITVTRTCTLQSNEPHVTQIS